MRVPLTAYGVRELIVGTVLCWGGAIVCFYVFWPPALIFLGLWLFVLNFFRDPERPCPGSSEELLCPADGTVADVSDVQAPHFIPGIAVRIGIFMSVFNVHVNRSPASGTVKFVRYVPGKFHDARKRVSATENEHNLIGLETEDGQKILINQIAGVIARRIVCKARPGDTLGRGERLGMIKFGSRVEVFLPKEDNWKVTVEPGQRVKAGQDVVAVRTPSG